MCSVLSSRIQSSNPSIAEPAEVVRIVRGTYAYRAGVSGTVVIPAGSRIMSWSAFAVSNGTVTINGGDTIIIPTGGNVAGEAFETLGAATFVFTSTDSYFIEFVT